METRDQVMKPHVKPCELTDAQWLQVLPGLSDPPSEGHLLTPTAHHISVPKNRLHLCSLVLNQGFPPPAARLDWTSPRASARFHGNATRPRASGTFPPQPWGPHHAGRAGRGGASVLYGPRSCPWAPAGVSPRAAR